MSTIRLIDTTLGGAQQKLWANRIRVGTAQGILPTLDRVGYWAAEALSGDSFEVCLRYLDENPWERVRCIKAATPNTKLSMVLYGNSLVGLKPCSEDVIHRFVETAMANGIEMFRLASPLNSIECISFCASSIKQCGAHLEGSICYEDSPFYTLEGYVNYARELKALGADSIAIEDGAGALTPRKSRQLVEAVIAETDLSVHVYCSCAGGFASASIAAALEAGATGVATASEPLAFGSSMLAIESMVGMLAGGDMTLGLDFNAMAEVSSYWEKKRSEKDFRKGLAYADCAYGSSSRLSSDLMLSLTAQLKRTGDMDRLSLALEEAILIKKELGYPALGAPAGRIIASQAIANVKSGGRWRNVVEGMPELVSGVYGCMPSVTDAAVAAKIAAQEAVSLPISFDDAKKAIGDLARDDEDVLMYALFPDAARAYLTRHRAAGKAALAGSYEAGYANEEGFVNIGQIRELIRIAKAEGVGEVSIEEGDSRIAIRMSGAIPTTVAQPNTSGTHLATTKNAGASPLESVDRPKAWHPVKAPMVGSFYVAPSPNDAPFVKAGDKVTVGQTLCILEAMKLMNEIGSEESGVIREVCPQDGESVEYGATLFYIEPEAS